jgi:hypothetical protein
MDKQPTITTDSDTLTTTQTTDGAPQSITADGPSMPELPEVP